MTIAYRTGFSNKIIDSDELLKCEPNYKFDKFQEYYGAVCFLFDPHYNLDKDVKKELARITLVAIGQMSARDQRNLLNVSIDKRKALTLEDMLPKILQLALNA
jgi:hypothetical protein